MTSGAPGDGATGVRRARASTPEPERPGATVTTTARQAEDRAMLRALDLARRGPAHGPNPRVGCVLLDPDGRVLGEGWHEGAGTPHAEVAAIRDASDVPLRGATAVVTLEPCDHTGRTGPCSQALLAAGVRRVVHAVGDPDPRAGGGAETLRRGGVDVEAGLRRTEGEELLEVWLHAVRTGRPWVTLKTATSLDGRVTAADGSSRWITSAQAREHAHEVRSRVDAIAVGTGTALADDPSLTARPTRPDPSSGPDRRPVVAPGHQPLRVVVGHREVPAGARLRGLGGELVALRTHDVGTVLAELARREVRHLLVEGGPTLASAFLRAGVVDELHSYLAPVLLGGGRPVVEDVAVATLADAPRWHVRDVQRLDPDLLVVARPASPGTGPHDRPDPTPQED